MYRNFLVTIKKRSKQSFIKQLLSQIRYLFLKNTTIANTDTQKQTAIMLCYSTQLVAIEEGKTNNLFHLFLFSINLIFMYV